MLCRIKKQRENKLKSIFRIIFIPIVTLSRYLLGEVLHWFWVVLALIFALLGLKPIVRLIIMFWSRSLFWALFKVLHVCGKENLEKNKNYIYVANHGCFLDIPAMMTLCPDLAWLGKSSYLSVPIFGTFLKRIGYIPVSRDSMKKSKQAIDTAIKAAGGNVSIGIFPEGTRTKTGHFQKFKRGLVMLVRNSNLDIVPVTFNGFYQIQPKGRFWVDPAARAEAIVHKPISNSELRKLDDEEMLDKIRGVIEGSYITPPNALSK